METKKRKRKLWIRLTAFLLVLTMTVGYWASAMIDIKIADDASNAAMSYLATNTEYVNKSKSQRFYDLVRSMKKSESLEDIYLQASMRIGQAKYEEALPYLDRCMEICSPTRYKDTYVDVLCKKGCILALLERNDEAIEVLHKAVETIPETTDAYLVLAQLYLQNEDLEKLEEVLKTYLDYKPEDAEIRVNYLQTLATAGKEEEAREQAETILATANVSQSNLDDTYHVLAVMDMAISDFNASVKSLEKIKDNGELYPDVFYDKGICYMSLGDLDKATENFTKSIELGYNKQASLYSRGVSEFSKEEDPDYQSAMEDIVAAYEYAEEDRDEEIAVIAEEFIESILEANKEN